MKGTGTLLLIPWHIGHRGDVTLNALSAARRLRVFLTEDAGETRFQLGEVLRVDCSGKEFLTIPTFRDDVFLEKAIALLRQEDVGLISSGGVPCFSDPGGWLVREARARGVPVVALAGASALTTLLSLSGYDWIVDPKTRSFRFLFFAVGDGGRLREALGVEGEPVVVFLDQMDRKLLEECLRTVAESDGERSISVFFDMTKVPKSKFPYANEVRSLSARDWRDFFRSVRWESVSDASLLIHPGGAAR